MTLKHRNTIFVRGGGTMQQIWVICARWKYQTSLCENDWIRLPTLRDPDNQ